QVDHPPLTLYVYDLVGHLYQSLVDPSFAINRAMKSQLLTWLIKLPAVLFQLATAAVVFVLVRRFASERRAWLAGTILLFDPAALMNTGHRGTFDSLHPLCSLLALAALGTGHYGWAGGALALAALSKPQSWILIPLVAAAAWRYGAIRGLLRCFLGGV